MDTQLNALPKSEGATHVSLVPESGCPLPLQFGGLCQAVPSAGRSAPGWNSFGDGLSTPPFGRPSVFRWRV